jgi:hypothetical protein
MTDHSDLAPALREVHRDGDVGINRLIWATSAALSVPAADVRAHVVCESGRILITIAVPQAT